MSWTVEISDIAEKQLKKLDKTAQKRIFTYLSSRLEGCKDPHHFGEPLKANLSGLWRYRIENYRVICEINEKELIILVLTIGHRRNIYKT